MKLILGLGNIGDQYTRTRHNIGFMVADELTHALSVTWRTESKFKADITEAAIGSDRLILAKPHTMMNLSGETAQKIAAFYKLGPADIWAVYDDVDVPFGRLRIRTGGASGGGHQGVNSLIRHLGPSFVRVKVGISLNDRTKEPSEVYVLRPFNPDEREQLPAIISRTADILRDQLIVGTPTDTTFNLI